METYRPIPEEYAFSQKNEPQKKKVDTGEVVKKRFDRVRDAYVEVVENQASRERLAELRTMSSELNKKIQEKLDQSGLNAYYSWNKSGKNTRKGGVVYPKILRLAFLLRPEHFKSEEVKTRENRYTTGDDQVSVFLHLTAQNHIQLARYHRGLTLSADSENFLDGLLPHADDKKWEIDKVRLEQLIAAKNIAGLADYFIDRVAPRPDNPRATFVTYKTEIFEQAYTLGSVSEAKRYLSNPDIWFYESPEIRRNVSKVVITSVLESALTKKLLDTISLDKARKLLKDVAEDLKNINIPEFHSTDPVKKYVAVKEVVPEVDAFINQTIQNIIKVYKPHIVGWNTNKA